MISTQDKQFDQSLKVLEQLRDKADLIQWLNSQNTQTDNLDSKALISYVNDWINYTEEDQAFDFHKFISNDMSSIMLGKWPVIFLGSNNWAHKRFLTEEQLKKKLEKWIKHLNHILDKKIPCFLVVIPEKDSLLRSFLTPSSPNNNPEKVVNNLVLNFQDQIVGFSFIDELLKIHEKGLDNYKFYDSHLLSRDYLKIFFNILNKLKLLNEIKLDRFLLKPDKLYGDLAKKLHSDLIPEHFLNLEYKGSQVTQVSGHDTFQNPLRHTQQSFHCQNSCIPASVSIYGDSHCSIYSSRKLTYLFSNVFEKCNFHWDPFSVNNKKSIDQADFVIFEISQRFLF